MLHRTFIRHLLDAYRLPGLNPALVEQVEEAAANLVGPDLPQRLTDAVWRLRLSDGQTAHLLVECQSQSDPSMPYRMLHGVATLAQALSRLRATRRDRSRRSRTRRCTAGRSRGRRGRRCLYDQAVTEALVVLWEASDRVCGKRLSALLPILVPALERHGHLCLDLQVCEQLMGVSAATIDPRLAEARSVTASQRRRRASRTRLRSSVQVCTFNDWQDPEPAFVEADLVAR